MSDANQTTPPKRRRRATGATGASTTASDGSRADLANDTGATTPKKRQRTRKRSQNVESAAVANPTETLDVAPVAEESVAPDMGPEPAPRTDAEQHAPRLRGRLAPPLGDSELRAAALAVNLQLLKRAEIDEALPQTLHIAPVYELNEFEPPFDAPALDEDPLLTTDTDVLSRDEAHTAADAAVAEAAVVGGPTPTGQKAPYTPVRAPIVEPPPPPLKPANLDYLNKARHAALEEAAAMAKLQRSLPRPNLWATATGIAAPLLAIGAFVAFNNAERADRQDLLSPASAEAHTPDSRALVSVYQVALQRIEAGQIRDGAAILRQAADGGLAIAQYRLAKLYERGEGVRRDLETAFSLSELAARAGNCRAMHDAGVFLARGEGTRRNEGAAFGWFLQAAELGVADSQYNVGLLYEQGRGVDANAEEALYWFLVAARQHDLNAIDRAVLLAAEMRSEDVARARARAHAFSPQAADAMANGVFDAQAGAACVSG